MFILCRLYGSKAIRVFVWIMPLFSLQEFVEDYAFFVTCDTFLARNLVLGVILSWRFFFFFLLKMSRNLIERFLSSSLLLHSIVTTMCFESNILLILRLKVSHDSSEIIMKVSPLHSQNTGLTSQCIIKLLNAEHNAAQCCTNSIMTSVYGFFAGISGHISIDSS